MSFPPQLLEFIEKNKKYLAINAAIIVAVLFVSMVFLISPLRKKIDALKNINQINQNTLTSQQTLISRKDNLKAKIERLNAAIPSDSQVLKLGSSLQTMAVKNSMLLKGINFNEASKSAASKSRTTPNAAASRRSASDLIEDEQATNSRASVGDEAQLPAGSGVVNSVAFSVNLVGSEENFKKFLQTIETNLRLIDVVKMTLPENRSSLTSDYVLELKAYYLSETPEGGK